jgi:rubrerythrin
LHAYRPRPRQAKGKRHVAVLQQDILHFENAFAGESQANRRGLSFAQKTDVESGNDVGGAFRSTSKSETRRARGHLEFRDSSGDPAASLPIGAAADCVKAAVRQSGEVVIPAHNT